MSERFAIYAPSPQLGSVQNPFGKDTANIGLFRALAQHGGFEELAVLSPVPGSEADLARSLLQGRPGPTRVAGGSIYDPRAAARAGSVLRGKADLADQAWLRRRTGDRAYSLLGLIHTIGAPAIREYLSMAAIAPLQPWDALICTSPSVQDGMRAMFDEFGAYIADRFGGTVRARPDLPLVPLGVDGAAHAEQADRLDRRAELRARLGVGPEDVLVLWLGRLSFFEKAFPQPMFRAVAQAAALSGRRLHFAMVGWFPNGEVGRAIYEEAARAHAPDMPLHLLDGNDRALVGGMWAASDIFLSLVDNIQETFGLTPLEAMAAGLPVVASDWDGYRYTMRDGIEGFLIRSLGGPPGAPGRMLGHRHVFHQDSYQSYVGTVAQHTAIDIAQAAERIARLAADADLRRRMGAAGRERVRTTFDWPVIGRQVAGLARDLAVRRREAPGFGRPEPWPENPVKGDPFHQLGHFATSVLAPGTRLSLRPGAGLTEIRAELERSRSVRLDSFADGWRANPAECAAVLELLAEGPATLERILAEVPPVRQEVTAMAVAWMCKLGLLTWEDAS